MHFLSIAFNRFYPTTGFILSLDEIIIDIKKNLIDAKILLSLNPSL